MKLKYYLRGAGVGLVLGTLLMSLTGAKTSTMTDAQVIERAKELGMIENVTLQDAQLSQGAGEGTEEDDTTVTEESEEPSENENVLTDTSDEEETAISAEDAGAAGVDENETTDEAVPDLENNETPASDDLGNSQDQTSADIEEQTLDATETAAELKNSDTEMISITIISGDSSISVSTKLQKAGIVDSASEFDDFLCSNDYDHIIQTGTYFFMQGEDYESIVDKITGK